MKPTHVYCIPLILVRCVLSVQQQHCGCYSLLSEVMLPDLILGKFVFSLEGSENSHVDLFIVMFDVCYTATDKHETFAQHTLHAWCMSVTTKRKVTTVFFTEWTMQFKFIIVSPTCDFWGMKLLFFYYFHSSPDIYPTSSTPLIIHKTYYWQKFSKYSNSFIPIS